jgi:hypothetical protein
MCEVSGEKKKKKKEKGRKGQGERKRNQRVSLHHEGERSHGASA